MNIESFASANRRQKIVQLIQDGPVSYRTLGFGLYNHPTPKWTPKTYHELTPQDYPQVAARQLVNRWKERLWKIVPLSVSGSTFPQSYIVRKDRRNPEDDHFVQHEDGLAAIFFAYANNPEFQIVSWEKPTTALEVRRTKVNGEPLAGKWKHVPDRVAVIQRDGKQNHIYFEFERSRKEYTRVMDHLLWYPAAFKQGVLPADAVVVWVTQTQGDLLWLKGHLKHEHKRVYFVTLPDLLIDAANADFTN